MSTFVGRLQRRPGCPACQEPDVVEILMTEEAYATVISLTQESPDVETGGVLIGFLAEGNRVVVVDATGPGPNATRTAMLFRRDIAYVQGKLDEAARALGPRGVYVGEWHSHLSADPQPGPMDMDSLFGIARVPNYLTRCPVMAIAGLDPGTGKVATIGTWAFPVVGRIYAISHKLASQEEALALRPADVAV